MKIENLKINRDTMLTLKRMNINTIVDLLSVPDNFLQDVNKFLCNVNECNKDSIMFDIGTLIEFVKGNKIPDILNNLYDENIKVDIATGIGIVYPNNICNSLGNFESFAHLMYNDDISKAKKYIQDIVEGKDENNVLSVKEIAIMKSRFKDLHSYKFIGDSVGYTFQNVKSIVSESLKKLNKWIGCIGTDSIEILQLSTRANRSLDRMGIKTCSQLKKFKEEDFLLVRGMGVITRNEILSVIDKLNAKTE